MLDPIPHHTLRLFLPPRVKRKTIMGSLRTSWAQIFHGFDPSRSVVSSLKKRAAVHFIYLFIQLFICAPEVQSPEQWRSNHNNSLIILVLSMQTKANGFCFAGRELRCAPFTIETRDLALRLFCSSGNEKCTEHTALDDPGLFHFL